MLQLKKIQCVWINQLVLTEYIQEEVRGRKKKQTKKTTLQRWEKQTRKRSAAFLDFFLLGTRCQVCTHWRNSNCRCNRCFGTLCRNLTLFPALPLGCLTFQTDQRNEFIRITWEFRWLREWSYQDLVEDVAALLPISVHLVSQKHDVSFKISSKLW